MRKSLLLFENITHIIFDLDGLLVDSEPLWKIAEEKALNTHGKHWQPEIARQHIGLRMDEAAAVMVKGYQIPVSASSLADEIIAVMFRLIATDLTAMRGAHEAIEKFHADGLILAIASSSLESYIRRVVHQMGWGSYMQVIASGYNVPRGKPAPDVYLAAAEMLNANVNTCLAFEDSVNGAKAAQAAQMQVCAIPGHDFTPADFVGIADFVLSSLQEVITLYTSEFGANLSIE